MKQVGVAVRLQTCMKEFRSDISWTPAIVTEVPHGFPQFVQANVRITSCLGQGHFIPSSLLSITH
jgi:hypothetical protein